MRSYVILLFSLPGVLRKYIRHIYCPFSSMSFSHIELKETITIICCVIFLLIFPTGFKGVLATYQTLLLKFFPTGFSEETINMMDICKDKQ